MRAFLPLIAILLGLGWGGLFLLLNATEPDLGPRWLFFFLVVVGFTGIGLPVVVFIYQRFPPSQPPAQRILIRQSLWLGIYAALLVWMNFGQVVNVGLAALVFVGIGLIELFLRLRERSFWRRP